MGAPYKDELQREQLPLQLNLVAYWYRQSSCGTHRARAIEERARRFREHHEKQSSKLPVYQPRPCIGVKGLIPRWHEPALGQGGRRLRFPSMFCNCVQVAHFAFYWRLHMTIVRYEPEAGLMMLPGLEADSHKRRRWNESRGQPRGAGCGSRHLWVIPQALPRYHWDCAPQLPLLRRSRMFVERFDCGVLRMGSSIQSALTTCSLGSRRPSTHRGRNGCV